VRTPIKATAREPINRPDTYQRLPPARPHLRNAADPYIRSDGALSRDSGSDRSCRYSSHFRCLEPVRSGPLSATVFQRANSMTVRRQKRSCAKPMTRPSRHIHGASRDALGPRVQAPTAIHNPLRLPRSAPHLEQRSITFPARWRRTHSPPHPLCSVLNVRFRPLNRSSKVAGRFQIRRMKRFIR